MPSVQNEDLNRILRNQKKVTISGGNSLPYPTKPVPREPQPYSINDQVIKTAPLIIKNNTPSVTFEEPIHKGQSAKVSEEKPKVQPLPAKIYETDPRYPIQTIKVKPGESFAIFIRSNPSTGYLWDIKGGQGLAHNTEVKPDSTDPMVAGSGFDVYHIYTAPKESGQTHINLTHSQAWDKNSAQNFRFNIVMNPN